MKSVVTGGAGFIGANLAARLLRSGGEVLVFDNLSRRGVTANLEWLRAAHPTVTFIQGDVRDAEAVDRALAGADRIYHLAAQVAVTTSVTDPRSDFETNLLGTLNVLEAARRLAPGAILFYTSTNKVYGGMEDVRIDLGDAGYAYRDLPQGVSEARGLDFHSPYGCSKGGADQYVRDYSRIYGLRTVVFRMSCIYGPLQCGNEDQGWIAHFARAALAGERVTLYGDGMQTRDVLFVDDLVQAFQLAGEQIEKTSGEVFNIGGGPGNVVSLLEVLRLLEQSCGRPVERAFGPWRPGDQRVYVSDIRKAGSVFAWRPTVARDTGIDRLVAWLRHGSGGGSAPS